MSDNIIRVDVSNVAEGLGTLQERLYVALGVYADTASKNFERYAKENRPWTDRTSRARQGLTGYVEKTPTGYRIVIAHTVDYGLWLELAKEKKYAILEPTVRLRSPEVIEGMRVLLS